MRPLGKWCSIESTILHNESVKRVQQVSHGPCARFESQKGRGEKRERGTHRQLLRLSIRRLAQLAARKGRHCRRCCLCFRASTRHLVTCAKPIWPSIKPYDQPARCVVVCVCV